MYEDLVKRLRELPHLLFVQLHGHEDVVCQAANAIEELSGFVQEAERDRDEYRERLDKANDALEELMKAAKAMHTWIFLNTGDEQAAYDECGLTDEMNDALGYSGQFVIEPPKEGT